MANCRPHSFDEQRIESTQSTITNYSFALWAQGYNNGWSGSGGSYTFGGTTKVYAPINVLDNTAMWSSSSFLTLDNLSLDGWQCYNSDVSMSYDDPLNIYSASVSSSAYTGTLYQHASFSLVSGGVNFGSTPSTMLIVNVGTTSSYLNINISGSSSFSDLNYPTIEVYYGKPWQTDGSGGTGSSTYVTGFSSPGSMSFTYNYTYNSSSGSYLYFILLNGCPQC